MGGYGEIMSKKDIRHYCIFFKINLNGGEKYGI